MIPKTSTPPPPSGAMYLFDRLTPPLKDGSYKVTTSTSVTLNNVPGDAATAASESHTLSRERYFDVVGPRFTLAPTDVADVYPPRNAHGAFHDALAQIVLLRETLPWERELAPPAAINMPAPEAGGPPGIDPTQLPWVALLLFEDGEYTLRRNVPLDAVVPKDVFAKLGSPGGIVCDAVDARRSLVSAIVPSYEETALLAHVRWVNVDDRELHAAGGDGFYAVVMTNRLATPGAKCRACLVSLEARTDLLENAQTAEAPASGEAFRGTLVAGEAPVARGSDFAPDAGSATAGTPPNAASGGLLPGRSAVARTTVFGDGGLPINFDPLESLVVLYTWEFTCESGGTFKELMTHLDSAIFGTVVDPGKPALTDTGHLRIDVDDRLGAQEIALYRGPLVAYELTRDPLGPYHSADQARRATPEAGVEDIAYAAAFEVGRLLAASDARLAQELMRWRRSAYRQAGRSDVITRLAAIYKPLLTASTSLTDRLHTPLPAQISAGAVERIASAGTPAGDAYGVRAAAGAPGLQSAALKMAWNLPSDAYAQGLLDGLGAELGSAAPAPVAPVAGAPVTLASAANDVQLLSHLSAAREILIASAAIQTGES